MTYSSAVLALNPIRYYKFAESSGTTAIDSSSAGVNGVYGPGSGTWTGGTLGTTGAVAGDTAASFTSGYVTIGDIPADAAAAFSFVGWVKVGTAGGYRTLFSKYDSNSLRFEISLGNSAEYGDDLGLVVSVNGASPFTAPTLAVGEWAHVAVVYDGSQATNADRIKVYVDAVAKSMTGGGTIPATLGSLATASAAIASRSSGGVEWVGDIDDVALFDFALSASQVSTLFAANGGAVAALTAATVQPNGAKIDLTFDAEIAPITTDLVVYADGRRLSASALSGSGTAWTATIGLRWVRSGQAVSVVYQGAAPIAATNSSTIDDAQVQYVGRRYGMFIHYGIETYLDIEWSTGGESIDSFAPTTDINDAVDQWVDGMVAAGMTYAHLTAKHHGGFCLWPSASSTRTVAQTAWYSANGSPDILRLYVEKCRAAGIGVGIYFSIWDRWWETANPGFTNASYETFTKAQLTEILTQYGPVDALWFDGWGWTGGGGVSFAQIPFANLYNHCKAVQPLCQVVVNNHEGSISTSDVVTYEVPVDGGPPANNPWPAEAADTIRADAKWFWKTAADGGKSASTLNSTLSSLNANRAAFLLNVPPDTTGRFPAGTELRLIEIGAARLERVAGISAGAGTLASRTVTLTLTTNGTTPAANLSGLRWAWWDQATPDMTRPPRAQGTGETTDASGVLSISVPSSLPVSGVGWLVVTNSTGNPAADHNAFSGPVAVS